MISTRKRILLLNPPGKNIYLRDYYCSHASKASYYWGPFDLIVLSGILRATDAFELHALDAIFERLSPEETRRRIQKIAPDTILFLTGAVSFTEDFSLIEQVVADAPHKIEIVATGDCILSETEKFFAEYPLLDAAILNFTSDDTAAWLQGERSVGSTMSWRREDGSIELGQRFAANDTMSLPLPDYDLFPITKYRIPHGRRVPFAGILTDYGCAFHCDYCIGGELGFRLRDLDNVIEEMRELKRRGIKELWIKDLTFGVNKKRTAELLQRMRDEQFGFSWVCLSRVNVLTEELLRDMHATGCHTIQMGVESASEEILKQYTKGIRIDQVREVIALCRQIGIRVLAHYILGLPGETVQTVRRTIDYALELDTEFASFNVAMPRMGTEFRKTAIEQGLISDTLETLDNSISQPVYETEELTGAVLWALRNEAIRRFHLRPSFVIRRLINVRSWYEFTTLFKEGFAMLATTFK